MTLKTLPPAGTATPGIRLESVTLARGDRVVLEHIDLHLTESRIGLVGDNGAGKSSAVGELSQGQRQQVCLMALQITTPATLLLDEPYSALDLPSQLRLSAQIAATSQQIILSTHLLDHVQDFERVLWLDQGKLRADGPGRDICAAYAQDVHERAARDTAAEILQEVLQPAAQADAT
ncbi:ABC transporter ATP-binding protein [Herbaspirillum lusitanum]|uniref:ABC transporter ATP-binding protein n=1 Tax=Herbaspirillum lusitanum TaxID=213312 RepID=UPI00031A5ADF|nr:ABC transporter ATP-binding protein [Herbaspirillum lusitanum]